MPSLHRIYSNNVSQKDARPSRSPLGFEPTVPASRGISNLRPRPLSKALGGPNANSVLSFKSGQEERCHRSLCLLESWRPSAPWSLASGCSRPLGHAKGKQPAVQAWCCSCPRLDDLPASKTLLASSEYLLRAWHRSDLIEPWPQQRRGYDLEIGAQALWSHIQAHIIAL